MLHTCDTERTMEETQTDLDPCVKTPPRPQKLFSFVIRWAACTVM